MQPLDLRMTIKSGSLKNEAGTLTALLRLFVALRLACATQLPIASGGSQPGSETRIRQALAAIIPALISFCARICSEIDLDATEAEVQYLS